MHWLYQLNWYEQPRLSPTSIDRQTHETSNWLIFADRTDHVGNALALELEQRGISCHLVVSGNDFSHTGPKQWTVNMARPDDFHQLLGKLLIDSIDSIDSEAARWQRIVYLWGLDSPAMHEMNFDQLETAEIITSGAALFLTQALIAKRSPQFSPKLWFVTRNAQCPGEPIPVVPQAVPQASLWGLGRTIELEYPNLWGGLIDLPTINTDSALEPATMLATELLNHNHENQIAFRENKRFIARLVHLEPKSLVTENARQTSVRDDVSYLISGGLGMIGLKVAGWLADQGARTLILTSRRAPQESAQKNHRRT